MEKNKNRELPEYPIDSVEENKNQESSVNDCSPVFVEFMQKMIEQYHVKRIDISRMTGISHDYLYKILNGTKHTAERDYIIAMSRAIGMNLEETRHALETNGMAVLEESDQRDSLIISSIRDNVSIRRLNDRLEKEGLPWLRVSSDMEQYVPER